MEHYVTLFDRFFLPQGLALYMSMKRHAGSFTLWILCLDDEVHHDLTQLNLPNVRLLQLSKLETAALLAVKPTRSKGEYCWTLTPFAPQFVIDCAQDVKRVTYLDADLFFLDSPQILLSELEESGKQVLITDHAYAPEYDQTELAGRFCVQFMTFVNNEAGMEVLHWWQDKCIEWCFDRYEDERFGDQKYLDKWPKLFNSAVHILDQTDKTLAPWNVRMFEGKTGGQLAPVFYHFQAFRILSPNKVMLYTSYRIGPKGRVLYDEYLKVLSEVISEMKAHQLEIMCLPLKKESWRPLRLFKRRMLGTVAFEKLD
jgi:hypothetical protein